MESPIGVRFWGTRGMVASPRKDTSKYGGNTSCIQILSEDEIIIIDAGFGISILGEQLLEMSNSAPSKDIHILFTHMHWDHIQGLPFFHPIYDKNTNIHLYSPKSADKLHSNLDILFDGSYSPFAGIDSMPANISFHSINQNSKIGSLTISYTEVNHGHEHGSLGSTFGYRFEKEHKSIAIIVDHEASQTPTNEKVRSFIKNANILIHDAQYTEEEYLTRAGEGHSTAQQAINNAKAGHADLCLLTHHDPSRNDFQIDFLKKSLAKSNPHVQFEFARENTPYWATLAKPKKAAG